MQASAATPASAQVERLRRGTRVAFATVLLTFLGVGVAVSGALWALDRTASGTLGTEGRSLRLLLRMARNRGAMEDLAARFLRTGSPADAGQQIADLGWDQVDRGEQFERLLDDRDQLTAWKSGAADRRAFDDLLRRAVAMAADGKPDQAFSAYSQAHELGRRVEAASDDLARLDARRVSSLTGALDRSLAGVLILNLFAVALGTLAAIVLFRQALAALRDYSRETQSRLEDLDLFAARVAHDLRQPLSGLSMLLGMVRGAVEDDRLHKAISQGFQTIQRLSGMIEDLLAFSRAGFVSEPLHGTSVEPVVAEIVAELERKESPPPIDWQLALEPQARVAMDAGNLRIVAWNLLENAAKYLPPDGNRFIAVRARTEAAAVRIVVQDSGQGIPPEVLGQVFEPFRRGTGSATGYGLGLATVKRLVEAHGGRIAVESPNGRGASFTVDLPRAGS